ncbi:MAG TPA: hypothetical protein VFG68_21795 [Fimbriiglobus sp.]|nr:hypothetical protein [Fimbriiglobus sp.]
MHRQLLWAVLLVALASAFLSLGFVWRAFPPSDASSVALAVGWVGGPFVLAAVLAVVFRRRSAVLTALLAVVAVGGAVGTVLFAQVADAVVTARRDVERAVLPGEDPTRGPAAMRKTGADIGSDLTELFAVTVGLVVPPVQTVAVALAAGIGFALSAWLRHRAEARRVWAAEHTDDRG